MTNELDDATRSMRENAAELKPPPLSPDAFARVAERRARGERVVLPMADTALPFALRRSSRLAAAFVIAAALLIAISHRGEREAKPAIDAMAFSAVDEACASFPTTRDSSTLRHLMVSAFGVAAACGAELTPSMPITVDPSRIRPGRYSYGGRSITDRVFTRVFRSTTTMTISRTTWHGAPALLAVRDGPLITRVSFDSLIVSAHDLTPLHATITYNTQKPVGVMHADFDSANVHVVLTGRFDTAATFPYPIVPGQLPFEWTGALVIPALPLAAGWSGTLRITPPIHPRASRFVDRPWETMALRVIGRESMTVAAGTFDCWKVQVGTSRDQSFMWVSVDKHVVVRSQTDYKFGDTEFEDQVDLESVSYAPK